MASVSEASSYAAWQEYFLNNQLGHQEIPWNSSYRLTDLERTIAAASIQQFQLGEGAQGRGLLERAAGNRKVASDPCFIASLKLFIREEQRHSDLLGRFLDSQALPRYGRHWIDQVFRRLRKLAGLETCLTVLVIAEVLAVPFYQALRQATHSPVLRAICRRILCDEVKHLNYQATNLWLLQRDSSELYRNLRSILRSILFRVTAVVVWQQHRRVFLAAGWYWRRFWTESTREFVRLQARIRYQPALPPGDLRIDD